MAKCLQNQVATLVTVTGEMRTLPVEAERGEVFPRESEILRFPRDQDSRYDVDCAFAAAVIVITVASLTIYAIIGCVETLVLARHGPTPNAS